MRIDPEAVYLELLPVAHFINMKTGAVRHDPAVTLHFKDGRKWHRSTFSGDSVGAVLANVGSWIDDRGGIDEALQDVLTEKNSRPSGEDTPASRKAL